MFSMITSQDYQKFGFASVSRFSVINAMEYLYAGKTENAPKKTHGYFIILCSLHWRTDIRETCLRWRKPYRMLLLSRDNLHSPFSFYIPHPD
jgi:hypothetical protein